MHRTTRNLRIAAYVGLILALQIGLIVAWRPTVAIVVTVSLAALAADWRNIASAMKGHDD